MPQLAPLTVILFFMILFGFFSYLSLQQQNLKSLQSISSKCNNNLFI